jgi:hypothetical protein
LFEILETWDADLKGSLAITVQGRDLMLEPETKEVEDLYRWQTVLDGEQWVIPPYYARFPDDDEVLPMPRVSCIDGLLFERNYSYQGVYSGAALQIAEHYVALRRLDLDLEEMVRSDHLTYIRDRRQGSSSIVFYGFRSAKELLACMPEASAAVARSRGATPQSFDPLGIPIR